MCGANRRGVIIKGIKGILVVKTLKRIHLQSMYTIKFSDKIKLPYFHGFF